MLDGSPGKSLLSLSGAESSLLHRGLFRLITVLTSGVPRNFVRGWGGSTNSVEDRGQREWGSWGGNPILRGSGGSCNLVQEISFHVVKFSEFLVL